MALVDASITLSEKWRGGGVGSNTGARSYARHATRRLVVATSLIAADGVALLVASRSVDALLVNSGLTDWARPFAESTAVLLLILVMASMGLYNGYGPSPFERFRCRCIGFRSNRHCRGLAAFRVSRPLAQGSP